MLLAKGGVILTAADRRQKPLTALLTLKFFYYINKKLLKGMVRCTWCIQGTPFTVCPVIIHLEVISQVLRLSSIKLSICEVWQPYYSKMK